MRRRHSPLAPQYIIPALLLFLLGIAFESAAAQSPVNPGQRIRATMSNGGVVVGTVTSVSGSESMTIRTQSTIQGGGGVFGGVNSSEGQTVDLSFGNVRRLELSAGMQSGMRKGAMWGAIGGVVVFGGIGAAAAGGPGALYGGLTGGIGGALNGLWIGHFFLGGEKWVPSPAFFGSGMSLVLTPRSGRSGVAVGLRLPMGR